MNQEENKMKNVISTDKAPAAIGPYSQAIEVNGMVYTSGIIPVVPATGEIPEGSVAQAKQAFDFGAINEVYAEFFPAPFPSRSCVEVARLPKDVMLEIEAIATK